MPISSSAEILILKITSEGKNESRERGCPSLITKFVCIFANRGLSPALSFSFLMCKLKGLDYWPLKGT